MTPNRDVVHAFLTDLHTAAARACEGLDHPGVLQLTKVHPATDKLIVSGRFKIGDVDAMADAAIADAEGGYNSYVEARTIREDTPPRERGDGETATRAVFGLVIDRDGDKGMYGAEFVEPTMRVGTSPGNAHDWLALDKAMPYEEARQLGAAIRKKVGADPDTGNPAQPYRVAGTPNYPGEKKRARGRTPCETHYISGGPVWSAVALHEAAGGADANDNDANDTAGTTQSAAELFATLSPTLQKLIASPPLPGEDRSRIAASVIGSLMRMGCSDAEITMLFEAYPEGIGERYADAKDLAAELRRMREKWEAPQGEKQSNSDNAAPLPTQKHGEAPVEPTKWLIRNRLPETGAGLLPGQWGTYKTFIAIDLAVHVMLGWDWTLEPVYRQGGVLVFAPEGAGSIALRLNAVVEHKIRTRAALFNGGLYDQDHPPKPVNIERLPIEWASSCPPLVGKSDPLPVMIATARAAHERFMHECGLPLVLILIDTMATAAAFTDENDNAEASRALAVMRDLSTATQSLVMGVDHLGKTMEAGTRGASSKEGNSDAVLAVLGDKELSGEVKNTRLALRKVREGPQGLEIPFTPGVVSMGQDERGYPVTSVVIDWQAAAAAKPSPKADQWTKSLRLLRKALMTVLVEQGTNQRPFLDGPVVRAVDIEIVRGEFYRSYPADGDAGQKQSARRQAFRRAIKDAQEREVIGVREVGGITIVWLAKAEDEAAAGAARRTERAGPKTQGSENADE